MTFLPEPIAPQRIAPVETSWRDAFGSLASASNDAQAYIEGINADELGMREVYRRQNERIQRLTGSTLENPYDVDYQEAIRQAAMATQRNAANPMGEPEDTATVLRTAETRWRTRVDELTHANPALAGEIAADLDAEKNALMRESKARFDTAAENPALGAVGKWSAIIGGGLLGAARDPYQWGMAMLGAGATAGRTITTRIAGTMLNEAALNAGAEAVLQIASQERKAEAGLDHGVSDVLTSVAIAGAFGAAFGGGVQGVRELARSFKFGAPETAALGRVAQGQPEPGDVELLAKATGQTITPELAETLARAREEDALDNALTAPDAGPREASAMEAALRHAQDPDEALPPEFAERLYDAGKSPRSMRLEDYEALYGLEPDDAPGLEPPARLRPERPAEPMEDAALAEAETLAGEISDPGLDANGNVVSFFDYAISADGEGAYKPRALRDVLEAADEENVFADLLEACKL